ncbi:MAG: ATP-dependent DNA helicase RecG [Pseudomonadota bacterium]
MTPELDAPVTDLRGVGPRLRENLARINIEKVQDLLFHLPSRYQDRTRVTPIGSLRHQAEVLIEGQVEAAQLAYGRRRSLVCRVSDGTGAIHLRFFHFSRAQQNNFVTGKRIRCFGEARRGARSLEMVHPEYQFLNDDLPSNVAETLTPIYPSTEGLHQATLRKLSDQALKALEIAQDTGTLDLLPLELTDKLALPGLYAAINLLHRPSPDIQLAALTEQRHPAQQRLAFEELLAHHLSLRKLRSESNQFDAPVISNSGTYHERFLDGLDFNLTNAQQRVIGEIQDDLKQPTPMLRLLQGDVGSGKTAVAAAVTANALDAGFQVALMAPTELLAEQHERNLRAWYEPLKIPVISLTSRLGKRERGTRLRAIAAAKPLIITGTHALFQDDVEYGNLGLIIVDEQHRFGVNQRLALRDKGAAGNRRPHQLIMTATPIPRTLAMTAYADLDVSVIDELPPSRKPVKTAVIPDTRRDEIVKRIAEVCAAKRQVYWVCPLIDESDTLESQAATETYEHLCSALSVNVGLIHGRLKDQQKDEAMAAFARAQTSVLVATTVIEVGVDVPNASLMIIENAERLGLSQLHQLRGRVGRGSAISDCVLMYRGPLSEMAKARLHAMRETTDGFIIAERDLELRGPGEVLGTRQAGAASYRIADLSRDAGLLPRVHQAASHILNQCPQNAEPLIRRWVAERESYAHV